VGYRHSISSLKLGVGGDVGIYVFILVCVRGSSIQASLRKLSQVYHCLRSNKYPFVYSFYLFKKDDLSLTALCSLWWNSMASIEAARVNNNQIILLILKGTGRSGLQTTRFST
jgi:hypothetical protein